ncbi:MAG: TIM-barrel domain-containing protein [Clostridia bacterium]
MRVFEINKEVYRYSFGNPICTYSVVADEGTPVESRPMDYYEVSCGSSITLRYFMNSKTVVYGLGENQRGMDKRGGLYHSYCSDDSIHTPDKKSLYGAHNFLLMDGLENFGVFVDFPGRVIFDVGFTHKDILEVTICGNDTDIYIIKGESSRNIVRSFISLIGAAYVPPKWAFGYQQSRWSYADAEEVKTLAEKFLCHDIPCDAINLDIDYMEDFKDFTIDRDKFPDFSGFVRSIKEMGFRLVPIIDAGVKIEKDYVIYVEGLEKGFFCIDQNNDPFVAAVWPGKVHFPDFLNSKARKWFGSKYKLLTDCGIEGFWNDMNEPAIFYTERGLKSAIEKAKAAEGKNLDVYDFFELSSAFERISNNQEDYCSFFHDSDGTILEHNKVHNLYGYYMTLAAAEGLEAIAPNKRFLLFSRASCIGMHRYSGIWTGDNHSWWEHLLLNIKMMPSINMCGFLYCGADIGGFSSDANSELLIRWMQFGIFTPLFRNHSALGTRRQEPFAFDEETTDILRNIIRLRYALVPYLYSEYMKAAIKGDMYFIPLSFEYRDEVSKRVEDQLLVGDSLMLCPVYSGNTRGRYVWLPEDMLLWRASDYNTREYEVVKAEHQYIEVGLTEVPIFIRKNRMLVIGRHAANIDSIDTGELHVIAFVAEKAEYSLYDDDGSTYDYRKGFSSELYISIEKKEQLPKIEVRVTGATQVKKLNFEIVGLDGSMTVAVIQAENFIKEV